MIFKIITRIKKRVKGENIRLDHGFFFKQIFFVSSYSHGTAVAGIIAAKANNNVCIVGVAHASKIIGNTYNKNKIDASVKRTAANFCFSEQ